MQFFLLRVCVPVYTQDQEVNFFLLILLIAHNPIFFI